MKFQVRILAEAEEDLFEIFSYVAAEDSPRAGLALVDHLEGACMSLATLPNRGRIPPELRAVGIQDFREIFFKVYRIIYRVEKAAVYIYAILDGRRDLTDLLLERLLR